MKRKCVPAIVTLSAGLVDCIVSIYYHLDMFSYLKQLLLVLILFYLIGCMLQWVLDFGIKKMEDKKEEADEQPEDENGESENENEAVEEKTE